jgi:hypothetical protein
VEFIFYFQLFRLIEHRTVRGVASVTANQPENRASSILWRS